MGGSISVMEIISKNINDTRQFAEYFLENFVMRQKKDSALLVALSGDLGAGKTAFVKELSGLLDIKSDITSPTFVFEKVYNIENDAIDFKHLVHIDAYRLQEGDSVEFLNLVEKFADKENIIFIEWPERIEEILPKNIVKIEFEFIGDTKRRIKIL